MGKKVKYHIAETFQEDGGAVKVSLRIPNIFIFWGPSKCKIVICHKCMQCGIANISAISIEFSAHAMAHKSAKLRKKLFYTLLSSFVHLSVLQLLFLKNSSENVNTTFFKIFVTPMGHGPLTLRSNRRLYM